MKPASKTFPALLALCTILSGTHVAATPPPAPWGAIPSASQIRWQAMELTAFVHFTTNTFTGREWGYGDESPDVFNPTAFDADQIVGTLADAGFKGLILTAKHHDGFCLWPSRFTEHSVKHSPWKNGKGDVVREFADACARKGMKFGIYLSPWDRNHPDYGGPAYVDYFLNQLTELMTQYGPVYEFWMDNANGGDGYYGGAREPRGIDRDTYYPWLKIWALIRKLQPETIIWGEIAPGCDVRWIGNERGEAGNPCWPTVNPKRWLGPLLNQGVRGGSVWMPGETNTSIRPGWFYHSNEDSRVKSASQLMELYFNSVGRSTNMLLNVPPDPRGIIHENDARALREWTAIMQATFGKNLAQGAKVTASNTRGDDARYAPSNVLANNAGGYWATDDSSPAPELILSFQEPVTFNVVRLKEHLPLGARIDDFALDFWNGAAWEQFAAASGIGSQRLLPSRYITTDRVRLRITKTSACPAVSEIALFKMPLRMSDPSISRDRQGMVRISSGFAGPTLRYTLDNTDPTPLSPIYQSPFPLPNGGTVKAKAFPPDGGQTSSVASATYGLVKAGWKILRASHAAKGGETGRLIDDDAHTLWNTWTKDNSQGAPQEVVIDLGTPTPIGGFTFTPRSEMTKGTPDRYAVYVSDNPDAWNAPEAQGEFSNIRANSVEQIIRFRKSVTGRYVRFVATHVLDDEPQVAAAEIGLLAP